MASHALQLMFCNYYLSSIHLAIRLPCFSLRMLLSQKGSLGRCLQVYKSCIQYCYESTSITEDPILFLLIIGVSLSKPHTVSQMEIFCVCVCLSTYIYIPYIGLF